MAEVCFSCPNCGETLEAPEKTGKTHVVCPKCEADVMIPGKRIRNVIDRDALESASEQKTDRERDGTRKKKSASWTNAALAGAVMLAVSVFGWQIYSSRNVPRESKAVTSLERADGAWTHGARDKAVAEYKSLLDSRAERAEPGAATADEVLARLYRRIIQYEFEQKKPDEARQWISRSVKRGLQLDFEDTAVMDFYRTTRRAMDAGDIHPPE